MQTASALLYLVFAFVSDIVEYVLLGDSGIGAECSVVEVTVEIGVDGALHPYVDGEGLEVSKAEKGGAGCHLVADTLDRFEAFESVFVAGFFCDFLKRNLARYHLFCRIEYVRVAETGL